VIFLSLNDHHDRKAFDCGNEQVKEYLHTKAGQQGRKDLARTVVMVEAEESTKIVGFFTLLMSQLCCDLFPMSKLPKGRHAPIILLAQFGVDKDYQGHGYGEKLIFRALYNSMQAAEHAGCLAVVVDVVDGAASFYCKYGFEPLKDDPNHLCISISKVRQMFPSVLSGPPC